MSKFKVGDRVIPIHKDWGGDEGVITSLSTFVDNENVIYTVKHNRTLGPAQWHEKDLSFADKKEVINHPSHYNWFGIECKDVTQHFAYNPGTAIAYIWRHGHKGTAVEDLQKAIAHLQFEIERLEAE